MPPGKIGPPIPASTFAEFVTVTLPFASEEQNTLEKDHGTDEKVRDGLYAIFLFEALSTKAERQSSAGAADKRLTFSDKELTSWYTDQTQRGPRKAILHLFPRAPCDRRSLASISPQ